MAPISLTLEICTQVALSSAGCHLGCNVLVELSSKVERNVFARHISDVTDWALDSRPSQTSGACRSLELGNLPFLLNQVSVSKELVQF